MSNEQIKKKWTVMVYMAGDNNLSIDMVYSLKEIREAIKQKNHEINLLVYYDGNALDMPTLYCDFTDFDKPFYTQPFKTVRRNTARGEDSTHPLADEVSAKFYSLTNFVDWCVSDKDNKRARKADHYALIVSGHGSGFQNLSFLNDEKGNRYMTVEKFRDALKFLQNNILKQKVDVLGFDNCVMSMLEIGNEISEFADVMVASEGSIPNAGWAYADIIEELVAGEVIGDSKKVGKAFVKRFIECQRQYAIGGVAVDIAAWDLSKVPAVTEKVNSLGEILYRGIKKPEICQQLEFILLQSHYKCQSYMFEQNIDLKDFCEMLSESAGFLSDDVSININSENLKYKDELVKRCEAVCDAVNDCILLCGFSGGAYQYSNGISMFFPWTYFSYRLLKKDYEKLKFANTAAANWSKFLDIYLGAVSLRGTRHGADENESVDFSGVNKNLEEPKKIIEDNAKIINFAEKRVINNAANRVINNAANKIINNAANKVINNAANRLTGNAGLIYIDFKNVAMPWYVTGFIEQQTQMKAENLLLNEIPPKNFE